MTAPDETGPVDEDRVRREQAEMASMIVHEVRNPIASIRGLASTGAQLYDKLSDAERLEFFELIDHEARRLGRMAEEISTAMKLDAGVLTSEPRDEPLAEVVREGAEAIGHGGHPVSLELDEGIRGTVDRGRLHELVGHLVENAVKFSPPVGPIEVRLRAEDGTALIEVLDSGPGIPPERREEAFGRFVRFRPRGYEDVPGAGLGLHISRGIAAAHGGTISVEDRPSGGTMLRVTLPLVTVPDQTPGTDPGEAIP
ncbi:MAG: HAMP domain-containing sensor histidine kinase [Actinomycetota bacterium]